ncbi:signal transduction histidine kinase [Methylohalomonas lacus]|uniref:Signal transduction histidine kinase n=1 Tax=Methylohalomonas lacus TaxID=398773 RepID=A0AAE3L499_9GAMM|nr:hypothetical protein [Methylohalomonas lacus]MCS3903533.1 signal transduction histidine kinase [Methylohalomonas lacus]
MSFTSPANRPSGSGYPDPALRRLLYLQAAFLAVAAWLALMLYLQQALWAPLALLLPLLLVGSKTWWRLAGHWLLPLLAAAAVTWLALQVLAGITPAALPLAALLGAGSALLLHGYRSQVGCR